MRILVVEDEADLNLLLCKVLTKAGYTVDGCLDGEDAQAHLLGAAYDGILLDVMLPKKDGYTLVRELRDQGNDTPVLFLTARDSVADRVKGLDLGGDDYLVKPFDFAELLARIRAVLRRTQPGAATGETKAISASSQVRMYRFNGWTLNLTARHLVDPTGMVVNLSGAEFRLLTLFLEHPQEVLSRDFLQEQAQGRDADRNPFDRSLDVQVCRLRARLRDNGREARLIKTVRGDGYVFTSDVAAE